MLNKKYFAITSSALSIISLGGIVLFNQVQAQNRSVQDLNVESQIKISKYTNKLPSPMKIGQKWSYSNPNETEISLQINDIDIDLKEPISLSGGVIYWFISEGGKWKFDGDILKYEPKKYKSDANTSAEVITDIPDFSGNQAQFLFDAKDVSTKIKLNPGKNSDQIINIRSANNKNVEIDSAHILFGSSYTLKKGDNYVFRYNSNLKKWIPYSVPVREYEIVDDVENYQLSRDNFSSPILEVKITDQSDVTQISLPQDANDRDKVRFLSDSSKQIKINNINTDTSATLGLTKGDYYEFMYIKDKSKWVLISSPEPFLFDLSAINQLPKPNSPSMRVEVNASNNEEKTVNNKVIKVNKAITLPKEAQTNDKVIIENIDDKDVTINNSDSQLNQVVKPNEIVRFSYNGTKWERETETIDVVLVNDIDMKVSDTYSDANVRFNLSIDLTNKALEYSKANGYFRVVARMNDFIGNRVEIPNVNVDKNSTEPPKYESKNYTELLNSTTANKDVKEFREKYGADAVYYQKNAAPNTTDYCGQGHINKTPTLDKMVAFQIGYCKASVAAHEFGHNMGISHAQERNSNSTGDNWGFQNDLTGTLMSYNGNRVLAYSSTELYHPFYGIQLGIKDEMDAIKTINKNIPLIAKLANPVEADASKETSTALETTS